jgi:signal transduction histidine kinase
MTTAAAFLAGALIGAAAAGLAARLLVAERAARYGRLFSFAMHELNTPVTAVNMTVINLLSGVFGEVPPGQVKWLEMTRDQIGRMNALVGEIRDLVHMEMHRDLRLNVGAAEPAQIAEDALASMRRGFEYAGIELKVDVPKDLPSVRTDADRASRAVASLLFHARKFRAGGPVTLSASRRGGSVAFEVAYAGAKLSPEEVRASLDVFYPARARKDQQLAATGLGLGLVREVTRRVGGDLEFSVDVQGASRLVLTAPVEGGA